MSCSPIILEYGISIGSYTQKRPNAVYMPALDCVGGVVAVEDHSAGLEETWVEKLLLLRRLAWVCMLRGWALGS